MTFIIKYQLCELYVNIQIIWVFLQAAAVECLYFRLSLGSFSCSVTYAIGGTILDEIVKSWRRWAKECFLPTFLWIPRPDMNFQTQIKQMKIYLNLITSYPVYTLSLSFLCYTSGVNWTWLYYRDCYLNILLSDPQKHCYFVVQYPFYKNLPYKFLLEDELSSFLLL